MRPTTLAAIVAVGAVLGTGAVLAYRDATAVETSLDEARSSLVTAGRALAAEDFGAADAAFTAATDAAEGVPGRLDGPVWAAVALVPRIGGVPELGRAAADLAIASADLGRASATLADEVLNGGALGELIAGGRIDLDQLDQLGEDLASLPIAPVRDARDRLEAVAPDDLPARVAGQRLEALREADEVLDTLDRTVVATSAMQEFLGGEGPRTYLVAAQNPSELRGTGGLIGFLTEIAFVDGDISVAEGFSFDAEDYLAQRTRLESTRDLPPPVDRPADFADRYDHVAGGQFFGSANLDPDLPTVGPVLLRLYEQETGRRPDGVILLDPIGIGAIVQATGAPLELPADLDLAGLPRTFPGSRIPDLVMVEGYDAFGNGGEPKKAFDRAIITASLQRLLGGDWPADDMARAVRQQAARRHLQVFSANPGTQDALELLAVAGRMPPAEDRDILAVTANNAGANKADIHVRHVLTGTIELRQRAGAPDVLGRRARLEVAVENPLRPGDHVDYITGSSPPVPFGSGPPGREQDALARTWLTIWTPPLSRLTSTRDGIGDLALRTDEIHGHRTIDVFLDTPSATTTSFSAGWDGVVPIERSGGRTVYDLLLWRQAKGIADEWDLTITAPNGWSIDEATVSGADPGAAALRVDEDGTSVRLQGALVEDARVRLVFLRP